MPPIMVETRQTQYHLYITGPEAMAQTGTQGVLFQSQKTCTSSQDARTQDAPEVMVKKKSPQRMLEQMNFPKEGN
jgi:hypothetical protein